ncbi:hypothetical protein [Swingsia samuiensis]|uniref:Uncharacterized protein n=1 Tax=Swingsia samuiensis TaxID=1293412 RepID=A0A4Y6UII1_9PROT|nr:hypothetical protein [Swingsia samuiensis]QDH17352.1 hypothetical protein E3D00_07100 [Swingsia samuiensis]
MKPFALFVLFMGVVASGFADAAPCSYDVTPLPVKTGIVSRLISNGVLLKDGTTVLLPEGLLANIRLGQPLTVRGLVSVNGHTVQAFALDGTPPVCPNEDNTSVSKGPFAGSAEYDRIQD